MSEVKWIKIVTDIFDDEKIQYIETLPQGDSLIVLWFRLLCMCGKSNQGGFLMMTNKIAYTDEMLASLWKKDIKIIQLALGTFQKLDMIEIIDNKLFISNWEKHQSIDKLEQIRENARLRVSKHREKQKELLESNVTVTLQSQQCNALDIDKDKDKDIDKDINNKESIEKEKKKKYGTFTNVLLTQSEFETLHKDFPNADEAIQYLSEYIEMKGYKAKSHYLAIRKWVFTAIQEQKQKQVKLGNQPKRTIEGPDWIVEHKEHRKAANEMAEESFNAENLEKLKRKIANMDGTKT